MEFGLFLKNIIENSKDVASLKNDINLYKEKISSYEDYVNFSVFKYLNSIAPFFIEMYLAYSQKNVKKFVEVIEKSTAKLSVAKIPCWITSYFIYITLSAFNRKSDVVKPVNFFNSKLNGPLDFSDSQTFGVGLYSYYKDAFDINGGVVQNIKTQSPILILPNGITSISKNALKNAGNIHFLFLPESLCTLTDGMFEGLSNVEAVFISQSVDNIPNNTFRNCNNLKLVVAPHVQNIGKNSFENTAIRNIKRIGNGKLQSIGDQAFKGCININSINAIDTKIGASSFEGCVNINELSICVDEKVSTFGSIFGLANNSGNLKIEKLKIKFLNGTIPDNFFAGCLPLKEIEIVDTINKVGNGAFKGCQHLENIIGDFAIESLGDEIFKDCSKLTTNFEFNSVTSIGNSCFENCGLLTNLEFVKPIVSLGTKSFSNCKNLSNLNFVYEGKVLPKLCFENCPNVNIENILEKIEILDEESLTGLSLNNDFHFLSHIKEIRGNAFLNSEVNLDSFTFRSGLLVKPLGLRGLKLKNIEIESSQKLCEMLGGQPLFKLFAESTNDLNKNCKISNVVINIDSPCNGIFKDFNTIEKVDVKLIQPCDTLGDSLFEGCYNLVTVNVESGGLVKIGNSTFSGCEKLCHLNSSPDCKNIDLSSFIALGSECFLDCKAFENIDLSSIEEFSPNCFSGCDRISKLKVKHIEGVRIHELFASDIGFFNDNYKNLRDLTVISAENVQDSYFESYANIVNIAFVGSVASLGVNAFKDCLNLTNITIDYIGNQIPDSCFSGCQKLLNIVELKNVSIIGRNAFENCISLSSLPDLSSVTKIGSFAFANTKIKNCTINPDIDYIGYGVFSGCSNIKSLTLPLLHSHIGMLFSSEELPGHKKATYYIKNHEKSYFIPTSLKTINVTKVNETFSFSEVCVDEIILDFVVTRIDDYCFYKTDANVTLNPENIESIGDFALAETKIAFDSFPNLKVIGSGVFGNNKNVTKLTLGSYLEEAKEDTFLNSNIKNVYLESNNHFILENNMVCNVEEGELFFVNKDIEGKIFLPKTVASIKPGAFKDCVNITSIAISDATEIGEKAFINCEKLEEINITSKLTKLGKEAFYECKNIKSISVSFERESIKEIFKLSDYIDPKYYGDKSLDLKTNAQLCEGWSEGFNLFGLLDLSEDILNLNAVIFKELTVNKLILNNETALVDFNPFSKCIINEIICGNKFKHTGNICYSGSSIVYCFNNDINYLNLDKIDFIYPSAFENVQKIDKLVCLNDKFGSFNEISHIAFNSISLTNDGPLDLANLFTASKETLSYLKFNGKEIKTNCFEGFKELSTVILDNVETLESGCFSKNCFKKDITLSLLGVKTIKPKTLCAVKNIGKIIFGKNLSSLDNNDLCKTMIEEMVIDNKNEVYGLIDCLLIEKKTNLLIYCLKGYTGDVTIPDTISKMCDGIFLNCKFKSITITSISEIKENTFNNCKNLEKVVFGENITIGKKTVFVDCPEIKNIKIAKIEDVLIRDLFDETPKQLSKVVLTKQEVCYKCMFSKLPSLEEVVLPNKVTEIEDNCFEYCGKLKELILPTSVKKIGSYAFFNCSDPFFLRVKSESLLDKMTLSENFDILKVRSAVIKILSFGLSKNKKITITKNAWKSSSLDL